MLCKESVDRAEYGILYLKFPCDYFPCHYNAQCRIDHNERWRMYILPECIRVVNRLKKRMDVF